MTQARQSDCPGAPGVELHAMRATGPGEAFEVGGHIVSLELSRDDEEHPALVGVLDVKGTLALERRSRALALANYAATQRREAPRSMALVLHGRAIAAMEVPSALRGSRFRVPLISEGAPFTADTETELRDALAVDRRCFPGR